LHRKKLTQFSIVRSIGLSLLSQIAAFLDGNLDTILQSELAVARERRKKQPLTVLEFFNLIQNVRYFTLGKSILGTGRQITTGTMWLAYRAMVCYLAKARRVFQNSPHMSVGSSVSCSVVFDGSVVQKIAVEAYKFHCPMVNLSAYAPPLDHDWSRLAMASNAIKYAWDIERLVAMGFPVVQSMAQALQVPLVGASDRKRAADLIKVIGNSMHDKDKLITIMKDYYLEVGSPMANCSFMELVRKEDTKASKSSAASESGNRMPLAGVMPKTGSKAAQAAIADGPSGEGGSDNEIKKKVGETPKFKEITVASKRVPVCKCGHERAECADCGRGYLTVTMMGEVPQFKVVEAQGTTANQTVPPDDTTTKGPQEGDGDNKRPLESSGSKEASASAKPASTPAKPSAPTPSVPKKPDIFAKDSDKTTINMEALTPDAKSVKTKGVKRKHCLGRGPDDDASKSPALPAQACLLAELVKTVPKKRLNADNNDLQPDKMLVPRDLDLRPMLTIVKTKSWFASVAVMDHLCDNWSLMGYLLDHVLDIDTANGDGPWRDQVAQNEFHHSQETDNDESGDDEGADNVPDSPGVATGRQRVAREKPTSKKELASLRERFQNTLHLCGHLYRDLSLRDDLRMVVNAVRPYLAEYSTVLSALKESQVDEILLLHDNAVFDSSVFLMKHHCYVNSRSDRVLMSLGFRTCAALGLRMVKHIVQED
ncbi:unnamed protein product, partial [Cladocopium goreaui]